MCEIPADELKWRQIGLRMWAKTFLNMDRLVTTSKNGPAACDIARRVIRDIRTGKVIDDCVPDSEPDDNLHRRVYQVHTIGSS